MPVKVFFNNSCNICKLEIDHYKKNSDENLEWVDITNNQQAVDLTSKSKEELLRRLHVIDNGQVIGGAKAFIIIWSKIPKYNFLAKILRFMKQDKKVIGDNINLILLKDIGNGFIERHVAFQKLEKFLPEKYECLVSF